MAPPRVSSMGATSSSKKSAPATTSAAEEDFPPLPHRVPSPIVSPASITADTPLPPDYAGDLSGLVEGSLRDIVSGLPTKQDLNAMATSIVNALTRELHDLKQQVDVVEERVTAIETSQTNTETRLSTLESEYGAFRRHLVDVQLRLDDGENRSRRNNLRLRGIPEATMGPDLRSTVTAILNQVLGKPPTADLELDRVHRIPGPRPPPSAQRSSPELDFPRDVLCRVHFFTIKEDILRLAWEKGPIDFDGAPIRIFPDISRQTRTMRGLMRPLLEVIREADATYRWGHPFHLIVRRQGAEFYLRTPDQLPALFQFISRPAIEVPNWFEYLLSQDPQGSAPPRQQRFRRPRSRPPNREVRRAHPTSSED